MVLTIGSTIFGALRRCRIAIEVGGHSPWVSRLLIALGHEVIVANARQVKLISTSSRKNDRLDPRVLARLARMDPELLRPIQHRSEQAQLHLLEIRARSVLMEARTSLVNAARGLVKARGERIPKCDPDQLGVEQATAGALARDPTAVTGRSDILNGKDRRVQRTN